MRELLPLLLGVAAATPVVIGRVVPCRSLRHIVREDSVRSVGLFPGTAESLDR